MLGRLKCFIFGHADIRTRYLPHHIEERCDRCGKVTSKWKDYEQHANDWLRCQKLLPWWNPVDEITDADGRVLRPGDRVGHMKSSALPGFNLQQSDTVEYIFEDDLGNRFFALKRENDYVREEDIVGYKPIEPERAEVA